MAEDTLLDKSTSGNAKVRARDAITSSTTVSTRSKPAVTGTTDDNDTGQRSAHSRTNQNKLLNTTLQLSPHQEMVRIVSNRLFVALLALMTVTVVGAYLVWSGSSASAGATNWMVLLCGAIGGFISLQRRLNTVASEDLLLLARSWVCVLLSPFVGSILALLLYFLFISGLLDGDLFPNFGTSSAEQAAVSTSQTGMTVLFDVQGIAYTDYAKLVFWCFLAGYSESFVTNIISNFETTGDKPAALDR